MSLGERIAQARKTAGLTQQQVASHFNLTRNAVSLWESGENRPSAARLEELATMFAVAFEWLATGRGDPTPTTGVAAGVRDAPAAVTVPLPSRREMPQNLPVLGTTVGGSDDHNGSFELNGQTIDYVMRPPGLAGARDAFALFVVSDSMAPRYEPGDLVFVHPHRPVTPGCDVVVELKGPDGTPGQCFIKRLVRMTARELLLAQFNPPRDDIAIARHLVRNVFRILTPKELLGV